MTGDEQRHQLVAQLLRGTSVSRPRGGRRAASRARRRGRRRRARRSSISSKISRSASSRSAHEACPRLRRRGRAAGTAASRRAGCPWQGSASGARAGRRAAVPGSSPNTARRIDLERQRLQPRVQRYRLVARPARGLALGDLRHEPGEALHLLAVEGRQHQLALLQMRRPRRAGSRSSADDRLEYPRALAGMRTSGGAVKSCFTSSGSESITNGGVAEQPDRESLAVAGAVALEERDRARPPADRLEQARRPRGPGSALSHHDSSSRLLLGRTVPVALRACVRCVTHRGPLDRAAVLGADPTGMEGVPQGRRIGEDRLLDASRIGPQQVLETRLAQSAGGGLRRRRASPSAPARTS